MLIKCVKVKNKCTTSYIRKKNGNFRNGLPSLVCFIVRVLHFHSLHLTHLMLNAFFLKSMDIYTSLDNLFGVATA